jgi:hypothetical protein
MPRDHFSKMMKSPYFQTDHFKNESHEALLEARIEKAISKFFNRFKLKRYKAK